MFNNLRSSPRSALEKIIRYFHRMNSPLYLGYISIEIGHSIEETQEMIDDLVVSGVIRALSIDEKRQKNIAEDANIYSLVSIAQLSKANPVD